MRLIIFTFTIFLTTLFSSSCTSETCGECWATVDGNIEETTKTGEVCEGDYELKKSEEQDVINYMETIYPGSVVEYHCKEN